MKSEGIVILSIILGASGLGIALMNTNTQPLFIPSNIDHTYTWSKEFGDIIIPIRYIWTHLENKMFRATFGDTIYISIFGQAITPTQIKIIINSEEFIYPFASEIRLIKIYPIGYTNNYNITVQIYVDQDNTEIKDVKMLVKII